MRIERRVLNNDALARLKPMRRKIPYAADAGLNGTVCNVLGYVVGHGKNSNLQSEFLDDIVHLADIVDRNLADGRFRLNVKTGNDIKPISSETDIGHQRGPETANPENCRPMSLLKAEKIAQSSLKPTDVIPDTRLASDIQVAEILGNLRCVDIQTL